MGVIIVFNRGDICPVLNSSQLRRIVISICCRVDHAICTVLFDLSGRLRS